MNFLYFIPCNTAENGRKHVNWKILENEPREMLQSRSVQKGNAGLPVPLLAMRAASNSWYVFAFLSTFGDSQPGNCMNSLYLTTEVKY